MIVWVSASSTFKTFQIQLTTKGKGKRENISKQKPEIHRIVKTWILKSTYTGCKYCCLLLLSFLSSSSSSFSLYIAICSVLFCSVYSSVSVYLWKKRFSFEIHMHILLDKRLQVQAVIYRFIRQRRTLPFCILIILGLTLTLSHKKYYVHQQWNNVLGANLWHALYRLPTLILLKGINSLFTVWQNVNIFCFQKLLHK